MPEDQETSQSPNEGLTDTSELQLGHLGELFEYINEEIGKGEGNSEAI